jgi:hypothetical protein
MIRLLIPSLLGLAVFLFFTNVHAANSCLHLFRSYRTALVAELERNQRLDWVVYSTDTDGSEKLWTLSYSEDAQFFSMFQFVTAEGRVTDVSIRPVTYDIEKSFYKMVSPHFEPEVEFFKIPGIGRRYVHVSGATQVKLLVKHGLTVDFLFKTLQQSMAQLEKKMLPTSIDKLDYPNATTYSFRTWYEGKKISLFVVFGKNPDDPEMLDVITAYIINSSSGVF